ncbi:hypothetical protein ABH931_000136 [Streptacidiphilus sp. MAP12-33]
MEDRQGNVQGDRSDAGPSVLSAVVYALALAAGVLLVCTHQAKVTEASGYVAPFLVIYERTFRSR